MVTPPRESDSEFLLSRSVGKTVSQKEATIPPNETALVIELRGKDAKLP
jgi:hypothetical protein